MERLSFVVVSALLLTGGLSLLQAQRGFGGRQSGGYSPVGSHYSHSGPYGANNSTFSNINPLPGEFIHPTPIGLQHQYSGFTGINPGALRNRGDRFRNRGYGYGYGPFLYPYYLSTFDAFDSPYAYNNPGPAPAMETDNVTANALGEQIEHLAAEVDSLRNERNVANYAPARPSYNAPPENAQPSVSGDDTTPLAPVTLILRSGKQVQLKSYAVMGQSIWDFNSLPAKRISLSTVDLNASRTATENNGGEFPEIR